MVVLCVGEIFESILFNSKLYMEINFFFLSLIHLTELLNDHSRAKRQQNFCDTITLAIPAMSRFSTSNCGGTTSSRTSIFCKVGLLGNISSYADLQYPIIPSFRPIRPRKCTYCVFALPQI